jgi:CubicO group peptidase (beta-lactamase class C family)
MAVCAPLPGRAQAPGPDAADRIVERWRTTIDAGRLADMTAFHRALGAGEEAPYLAGEDYSLWEYGTRVDHVRYLVRSDTLAALLVRLRATDAYRVLSVSRTDGGAPQLSTRPAMRDELAHVPRATATTVLRRMRAQVDRVIAAGRFNGTLLVARHDTVVLARHAGLAHRGLGVPIVPSTRFNIASVGKLFTGLAVARLIESGRVTLDTKVGAVLPGYPNARVRDEVTMHMLLSHRSGIPNPGPTEWLGARVDSALAVRPLDFAPDSMQSYSNTGFVLLGEVIARITGREYWIAIDSTLLTPLGLRQTGPCAPWVDTPGLALGYTYDRLDGPPGDQLWNNSQMVGARSSAAGGACSTAADLLRLMTAVHRGRVVSAATLARMRQPAGTLSNVGSRPYGLALEVLDIGAERAFGHTGGHPGTTAYVMHFERSGHTIVSLSNRDREASRLGAVLAMLIADTVDK